MSGFEIPRPEWVSDELVARAGENAGFQMYSTEGNDACAKMVSDAVTRSEQERWRRSEFMTWLKNAVTILALTHPEVHDTEPEWAIVDAVNAYFDTEGWVHVSRDDLF